MSFSTAGPLNKSVEEISEETSENLKDCLGKVVLVTHKASDDCAAMVEAIQAENYRCYVSSNAIETISIIKDGEFDIVFVVISIEDSFKIPQQIMHYEMTNKAKFVQLSEDQLSVEPTELNDKIDLDSIKTLSEKEKQALKLRYYSEEDFIEISKALNTSEANSRKLVSRGIKKLKAKLLGETT